MAPCPFCEIAAGQAPAAVVYDDAHCQAFMDIHPITSGHVLVVPRAHVSQLTELAGDQVAHLFQVSRQILKAQRALGLGRGGSHLLVNDGKAANQHVPHVHIHLIPRQRGDGLRSLAGLFLHVTGLLGRRAPIRRLREQAITLAAELESTARTDTGDERRV